MAKPLYRPIAWWRHIWTLVRPFWLPPCWGSEMYCGDWEKGTKRIVVHQCKWLLQRNYNICKIQAHRPFHASLIAVVTGVNNDTFSAFLSITTIHFQPPTWRRPNRCIHAHAHTHTHTLILFHTAFNGDIFKVSAVTGLIWWARLTILYAVYEAATVNIVQPDWLTRTTTTGKWML